MYAHRKPALCGQFIAWESKIAQRILYMLLYYAAVGYGESSAQESLEIGLHRVLEYFQRFVFAEVD